MLAVSVWQLQGSCARRSSMTARGQVRLHTSHAISRLPVFMSGAGMSSWGPITSLIACRQGSQGEQHAVVMLHVAAPSRGLHKQPDSTLGAHKLANWVAAES